MPKVWNKRHKGIPLYAVYVGRPTKWGNPFSHLPSKMAWVSNADDRLAAITLYKEWIYQPEQEGLREAAKQELKGRDLICWCAPKPCHADILMEIANS